MERINQDRIISILAQDSEGIGKNQVKRLDETERKTLVAMLQALQKGTSEIEVDEKVLESMGEKLKNRDVSSYNRGSNFLEKLGKFLGKIFSLRTSSEAIVKEMVKTREAMQGLHERFDIIKDQLLAIDEYIIDYKQENNIEFYEDMDKFYKELKNSLGSKSLTDLKSVVKEKFEKLEDMRSSIIDAKLGSILEKNLVALEAMLKGDKNFMEISITAESRKCAFVLDEEKEWLATEFANLEQLRERKDELLVDPRVVKSMENEIIRIDKRLANLPTDDLLEHQPEKILAELNDRQEELETRKSELQRDLRMSDYLRETRANKYQGL